MPQLTLLFAFVVSAVLTAFVIPKIILISYKKKLFDFADERKSIRESCRAWVAWPLRRWLLLYRIRPWA